MFGLIEIALGVIVAFLIIFVRNANVAAHQQKAVAIRLKSYLIYWRGELLDENVYDFVYVGIKWNKDTRKLEESGGSVDDLIELDEKTKKDFFSNTKETIKSESDAINAILIKNLKMPKLTSKNFILQNNQALQNLIEGKVFVSDEEASCLDLYSAQVCIELKIFLVDLLNSKLSFHLKIVDAEESFQIKDHENDLVNYLWTFVLVSKNIDTLSRLVDTYTERSTFRLTINNIFSAR